MRVDKMLGNMGFGSRKDVKFLLRKKRITVNGEIVVNGSAHVSPDDDIIKVDKEVVHYKKYIYIMLHKPKGYLSATEDNRDKTVIDLLVDDMKRFSPAPVGRLDKNTEGLLLLTNDGELNHYVTSPKNKIPKKYEAIIQGQVTEENIATFNDGVVLDDGYKTKPATLEILTSGEQSHIHITITEGKFHQIKRMFQANGMRVVYLKRIQMGELILDDSLKLGSYRELTSEELNKLR